VRAEENLVTRAHIGACEQRQQFFRAACRNDALHVKPVPFRYGVAKEKSAAVRIGIKVVTHRLIGGHGPGTGPKRRFIGGEFERGGVSSGVGARPAR